MGTKVVCTVREEKLQKQSGCMNGIFHLLDRGYLLGLHRHSRNQNRLTQGEGENSEKELKKSSEKDKEKNQKKMMMIEKNRASVESSRNSSSSSSCSSTTFSSFDCSKRVQTEWQLSSEPTSPNLQKQQPEWCHPPADIRDVVNDSMTRVIRVTKNERAGPVMKHIDSPRPFIQQISIQYDRKDQNLAKIQKISSAVKEVQETSRYSCDERESQYSLKSSFNVKELPRLSLDSKQKSKESYMSESRSEPGSNKKPSSGIVARLMGLDTLTDSICEVETLKIKPTFGHQLGSSSPRVHSKTKPVLLQQESSDCGSKKPYVYDEMEKRLSALEFKSSGNDLRALKQIVEAMQMTKTVFENREQCLHSQKNDHPGSPTVKATSSPKRRELLNGPVKPAKVAAEPMMATVLHGTNSKSRKQVKDPTPRNIKVAGRTSRSLEDLTGERPVSSPRLQRSKNGNDKHSVNGPSSGSSRIKTQSKLKTRPPKIKPMNTMQNNDQSCMYIKETRTIGQDVDAVNSHKPESKQDVARVSENNFRERLIEDKPMVELAKLTMEQTSPISVLDTFYVENIPSPVKNKPDAFNDCDNLCIYETEWNQMGIYKFPSSTDAGRFHQVELLNSSDGESAKSQCKSTNGDHKYIREILLASGFLSDQDSAIRTAQLHSTASLIKPELFHILEKTNDECHEKNRSYKSNEKVRRKLIFDSVNDILFYKLVMSGFCGKRCGRFVDAEKLLIELSLEIDSLQSSSERCIYDDDDEVKILVSADLNKKSQEWDTYCYEVPGLVLDIERLIFKDMINEIVNDDDATHVQDQQRRHNRRLFSMYKQQ